MDNIKYIQYMSDIHFEIRRPQSRKKFLSKILPIGDYLVLCGDIGDPFDIFYYKFLEQMSKKFKLVLLVTGNHEYYNDKILIQDTSQENLILDSVGSHSLVETFNNQKQNTFLTFKKYLDSIDANQNECLGQICNEELVNDFDLKLEEKQSKDFLKFKNWLYTVDNFIKRNLPKNCILLQDEYIEIDNLLIYGTTLWTQIPQKYKPNIESELNDYFYIPFIKSEFINIINNQSKIKLLDAMEKNKNKKFILITHHLPRNELLHICPKHTNSYLDYAYANDYFGYDESRIKAWFFGHSHKQINKDIYYSNPIGYPGEMFYDLQKTILI